MTGKPLFSVVIPTCDRADLLSMCLDNLAPGKQTVATDRYEVIVTDDGRIKAEALKKKYSWVKFVEGPRKGPASNRNNGAKYAEGQWLIFLDDDCIPDPEWLQGYDDAIIKKPEGKVFEGRTYVKEKRKSLGETTPSNESGGFLWSCNFVIEADLFKNIGMFNERFPFAAMEDIELRTRLIKSKNIFLFVYEASVNHPWRDKEGWKKLMQHQQSTLIYLSIHPDQLTVINSKYYLEKIIRQLIKETIPGMFKYKFKGIGSLMLEHIADFKMFFILLFLKRI